MKLVLRSDRVTLNTSSKSVSLTEGTDSTKAREMLREMAAELVSGNSVRSGYLRLKAGDGGSALSASHFGSGATAATDLVTKLVDRAYGQGASSALQAYLAKSGNRIGTRSFFKLVRHMESNLLPEAVSRAALGGRARLGVIRSERGGPESLSDTFKLNQGVIEGASAQLSKLQGEVQSFETRWSGYVEGVEHPATIEEGELLLRRTDHLHKLVLISQPEIFAPGIDKQFAAVLATLRFQLASMIIERHELPINPEHPDRLDPEKRHRALQALKQAQDHLLQAQKLCGEAQDTVESGVIDEINILLERTRTDLKAESDEGIEIQVEDLSHEEADIDALREKHQWNLEEGGKTHMELQYTIDDLAGYQSITEYQARLAVQAPQGSGQEQVDQKPAAAENPRPAAAVDAPPSGESVKEKVSTAALGDWMSRDLKGLLQAWGKSDADSAQRTLGPPAQWLSEADERGEGDEALGFLQQVTAAVQGEWNARLDPPIELELNAVHVARALESEALGDLLAKVYGQQKVDMAEYLALRTLLMMTNSN